MSRYSLSKEGISKGGYVSTCDGILCYEIENGSSALLFNPSIRNTKSMILPSLKFPDQSCVQIIYTLVYDRFINKYKVIALNAISPKMEVNVHILGTDYWRRIQDFPVTNQILSGTRGGIFVSDSVNWLVSTFVVSLDLKKESYQKFSLPVSYVKSLTTLGTLRGCLSLPLSGKCSADIWIMKEFGNEKSWTKLLTVPYFKEWGLCHLDRVLYISEDDQVLMEIHMVKKKSGQIVHTYRVTVYDSINNTFQFPEFQNKIHGNDYMAPEVYVESLISPF
jgi:F-box interacting protein